MRSERMSPLPGPGVFARSSSNATPALLPDGSIAPGSVSDLVEFSESEQVARRFRAGGTLTEIESAEHPQRTDMGIGPGIDAGIDTRTDAVQNPTDGDVR
jgi:NADH-quinone oxidoreductase subunit J